jgi:membrane protease YdiL (CAAX protease family)
MGTSSEPAYEHIPLGQRAETYWVESRRPLASLVFIAPLLIVYELGVLLLGVQNGADDFMRSVLNQMGFGHFLLPILTVCILLGWHYLSRQPWRISGGVLSAMAVECLLLGVCLKVIVFAQHAAFCSIDGAAPAGIVDKVKETVRLAVSFLGAGIYEELLFRLILLSVVTWGLRRAGTGQRMSTIAAVIFSSLLFAAAHHVGLGVEPYQSSVFLFRTLAGIFFSIVFLYRGFGIAAGSHAAFDILAGLF